MLLTSSRVGEANMSNIAAHALVLLRAAARECQLAAPSFSDEQAAEGLAAIDELRAHFLPRPASSSWTQAALLLQLPLEILSVILSMLGTRELARLAASCRSLWCDDPTPPPPPMPPAPSRAGGDGAAAARPGT